MYFDRANNKYIGGNVGMNENDAVHVINQLINTFSINRTKLADFISPAILVRPNFGGKKP